MIKKEHLYKIGHLITVSIVSAVCAILASVFYYSTQSPIIIKGIDGKITQHSKKLNTHGKRIHKNEIDNAKTYSIAISNEERSRNNTAKFNNLMEELKLTNRQFTKSNIEQIRALTAIAGEVKNINKSGKERNDMMVRMADNAEKDRKQAAEDRIEFAILKHKINGVLPDLKTVLKEIENE